jgi:hypothetical protein
METYEQRISGVLMYNMVYPSGFVRAGEPKTGEAIAIAREADAALAASMVTIDRLTALNTAKGELIECLESGATSGDASIRERIRSLENGQ